MLNQCLEDQSTLVGHGFIVFYNKKMNATADQKREKFFQFSNHKIE
jgi:hypothetical protein